MGAYLNTILNLLVTPSGARTPRVAALWVAAFLVVALLVCPRWFQRVPFAEDWHAYTSLGEALDARYCGKPGQFAPRYNIGLVLVREPLSILTPFPELLASRAGSVEAYCKAVDLELLNNENSMMLLMRAGLSVVPHPSAARLGAWLASLRLAMLLTFAYALLDSGFAIPLALVAFLAACDVSNELRFLQYSIYSFFVPLLLVMPSLYVLAMRYLAPRGAAWRAVSFLTAGFLTAFCTNMRSSHLPVYLAMFIAYALCARTFAIGKRLPYVATAVLCFVAAYGLFGWVFIRPLQPKHASIPINYSHHVIAHPLVLGLAVPPNDLSRREGIEWNDDVGLGLARRMVSDAQYLGPGYEEGLFLYYAKLWLLYPAEMRGIYGAKLHLAGTGMGKPGDVNRSPRVALFVSEVAHVESGAAFIAIALVAFAGAAALYVWRRLLPAFLFILLSAAGVLLLLESAIIMPTFYLRYHGYLLVYAATLIGLIGQAAIDAVAIVVRRFFAPRVMPASA